MRFWLLLLLVSLLVTPVWALQIRECRVLSATPALRLQKLELGLLLDPATFHNPYDPDEITVSAEFISPGGEVHRALGFWYQDFRRCTTCPPMPRRAPTDTCLYCTECPDPGYLTPAPTRLPWRIRFAPPEAGRWTYRVLVRYADTTVAGPRTAFSVAEAANPGYVRVHPNGRNFAFADGQVFFPIGMNVVNNAAEQYTRLPYQDVHTSITRIADSGGNFARFFLTPETFGVEGPGSPAGHYDQHQNRAYDLDALVEHAARRRVYLQVSVVSGPELFDSDGFGHAWRQHPYYALLGPGTPAVRFFTDSLSQRLLKQRIRYIMARWGYSPALFALELMNETDMLGAGDKAPNTFWDRPNPQALRRWTDEMLGYARTLAPQHLFTTSVGFAFSGNFPNENQAGLFYSPHVDFVQDHYYSADLNVEHQRAFLARRAAALYPGKPYLLAEFALSTGTCWYGSSNFTQNLYPPGNRYHDLIEMHNTLWSSAFNGSGGAGLYWWANQVFGLCYGGQYHYFRPLQTLLAGSPIFAEDCQPIASPCPGTVGPKDQPHEPTTPGNCAPVWATSPEDAANPALQPGGAVTSTPALEVFALRSPARVVGWVHNRASYWYRLPHWAGPLSDSTCRQFNDNQPSTPDSIPALVGEKVTIPGLAKPGRYRLEFFSTYPYYALRAGGPLAQGGLIPQFTTEVRATTDTLTFTVPPLRPLGTAPFAPDYGFRLTWLPDNVPVVPKAAPKVPIKAAPKPPARKSAAPPAGRPRPAAPAARPQPRR